MYSSDNIQRSRFVYSPRPFSIGSKSSLPKGNYSLTALNQDLQPWNGEKSQNFRKTMSPIFDHVRSNGLSSDKVYAAEKSAQNTLRESYVNRLRRASATVWCEHGTQLPVDVKMTKSKSFVTKKGFAIKSLVFPHTSIAPFSKPMAQHARSTNDAAPQHTMLIPRLSATETCFDEEQDDDVVYSSLAPNDKYHSSDKIFRFMHESVEPLEPLKEDLEEQSDEYIEEQIEQHLNEDLENHMENQIREHMGGHIMEQIEDQMLDQMQDQMEDRMEEKMEEGMEQYMDSLGPLETDIQYGTSIKNSHFRSASVKSASESSHYSHSVFSSSPGVSKNSIFSKHINEFTDNTMHTSLPSRNSLYTHVDESYSSVKSFYPPPTRKLYIVNLTKHDIFSDDET
ncbi:hypothetical protein MERGE_002268 [Pneumocystis wakefieldiae]|uniref:Uncharacterized protein n=1 Tax=Pneumocystis wakefieldiae TaxID=38082 RepID=A0A899FXD9_9ASCO|nr:hypothetical protein MERGE_002268 [Pneumocystis wakefieldiae]